MLTRTLVARSIGVLMLGACVGASGPLALVARVERASFDVLAPVATTIVVRNDAKTPIIAAFPTTDEYEIAVRHGSSTLWSWTASHPSTPIARHQSFPPGLTTLVVHDWNGLLADGTAPRPGTYTLHVALIDTRYKPSVDLPIRFVPPFPIDGLSKLKEDAVVTVAGHISEDRTTITDATGSVLLSRPIVPKNDDDTMVVLAAVTHARDGSIVLYVQRFAAMSTSSS